MNNKVKQMLNEAMAKQICEDVLAGRFKDAPNDEKILLEAAERLADGKNMTGLQKSVRMAYYWDPKTENSNPDYNPNLK